MLGKSHFLYYNGILFDMVSDIDIPRQLTIYFIKC